MSDINNSISSGGIKTGELTKSPLEIEFLEIKQKISEILDRDSFSNQVGFFGFLERAYNTLPEDKQLEYKDFYNRAILGILTEQLGRFNVVENMEEIEKMNKIINKHIDDILEIKPDFDFKNFDNQYLKKYINDYLQK